MPLTDGHILDVAVVLKREEIRRSATHVADVLGECGWSVSARTAQRHFARPGLDHRPPTARRVFGRLLRATPATSAGPAMRCYESIENKDANAATLVPIGG